MTGSVLVGVSFFLSYSCIVRVSKRLQALTYVGMMEARLGRRVMILLFLVGALAIMDTILRSGDFAGVWTGSEPVVTAGKRTLLIGSGSAHTIAPCDA